VGTIQHNRLSYLLNAQKNPRQQIRANLEKQLNSESLKTWLTELDKQRIQKVDLSLPKFKFETDYDLVSPFVQLGMKVAFAMGRADFRGMGGKDNEANTPRQL